MVDPTALFYSQPSYTGAGFPVFSGSRRQRGGNIFGSLAKMVLPALKTAGKTFLRRAGREAIGFAGDLAGSALSGRGLSGVKQTLQRQGLKRLSNVGKAALSSALDGFRSSSSSPAPKRRRPAPPPPSSSRQPTTLLGKRKRGLAARAISSVKRRRRGGGTTAIANF